VSDELVPKSGADPPPRLVAVILGAFALGSLVMLAGGGLWWWLLAGLVAGTFSRGRFTIAGLSLLAAGVTWATLHGQFAPPPAFEGPDVGVLLGPPLTVLSVAAGLWLGSKMLPSPRPVRPPRPGRTGRLGFAVIAIAAGALAILAASISWAVEMRVPSRLSFEMPLPAGWTVLSRQATGSYFDPTYGDHWTAVRGADKKPTGTEPPAVPVLGVTVIRAPYEAQECIRSVHGWSTSGGPVYAWPIIEEGAVQLPVGPAYRVVRKADTGSASLYGWGITRTRQVGVVQESLCYMLVLTTPADAGIGADAADGIAAGFSFR
jgi:hypothetical protein